MERQSRIVINVKSKIQFETKASAEEVNQEQNWKVGLMKYRVFPKYEDLSVISISEND